MSCNYLPVLFKINDEKTNHYGNEKSFVAMNIYLIDEKKDTTIVYAWVLQEKYYIEDGETKIDTSSSIPYKFSLIKENDHYTLKTVETPGDGKNYSKDMKKLFPYSVRKSMDNVYNDGTSENLKHEISEQVLLYYDKDI